MAEFTFTVDNVIETTTIFRTLSTMSANGNEQRRSYSETPLKTFKVRLTYRTKTEMDAVETFFNERLGSYESFDWTNPDDGVQYLVKFASDEFPKIRLEYNIYSVELTLQEDKA